METGDQIRGPLAVQKAIIGLHANMAKIHTRQLASSEESAYIEGTCLSLKDDSSSISYCVAYDLSNARIAVMRAYGSLSSLMPKPSAS